METRRTEYQTREEQYAARKVGGSDAAIIMGCYGSIPELWERKVWGHTVEQTEAMAWGNRLEPLIGDVYRDETDRVLRRRVEPSIWTHPDIQYMTCIPDGFVIVTDRDSTGLWEAKLVGGHMASRWRDGVPRGVWVQCQHNMAVTGLEWASVAALIADDWRLMWADFDRDDEFIANELIPKEEEFWGYVTRKECPPVDGEPSTAAVLGRLYPDEDGETVDLPPEAADWDALFRQAKAYVTEWGAQQKLMENKIREAIGKHSYGSTPGAVYSLHKVERKGFEVNPSSYRKLHRKEVK